MAKGFIEKCGGEKTHANADKTKSQSFVFVYRHRRVGCNFGLGILWFHSAQRELRCMHILMRPHCPGLAIK